MKITGGVVSELFNVSKYAKTTEKKRMKLSLMLLIQNKGIHLLLENYLLIMKLFQLQILSMKKSIKK